MSKNGFGKQGNALLRRRWLERETNCWQVKGADNSLCKDVCIEQGDNGCDECPIKKAFDRLAAYEDTGLGPEAVEQIKLSFMGKSIAEITDVQGGGYSMAGY